MMLSVIIQDPTKKMLQKVSKVAKDFQYEVISTDSVLEGVRAAVGQYLVYLEPGSDFSENLLRDNLHKFAKNPLFRKMAMMSPVVSLGGESRIYGFFIAGNDIFPSYIKSSQSPYPIQIGYFPGSIIRTTVLREGLANFSGDMLKDSVDISLGLWRSGNYCYVNPDTLYSTQNLTLETPTRYEVNLEVSVRELFRREYIK